VDNSKTDDLLSSSRRSHRSRGDCSARTGRTPACAQSDRVTHTECEWKPCGGIGSSFPKRRPPRLALTDKGLLMEAFHYSSTPRCRPTRGSNQRCLLQVHFLKRNTRHQRRCWRDRVQAVRSVIEPGWLLAVPSLPAAPSARIGSTSEIPGHDTCNAVPVDVPVSTLSPPQITPR